MKRAVLCVASDSRWPQARVLRDSVKRYLPEATFYHSSPSSTDDIHIDIVEAKLKKTLVLLNTHEEVIVCGADYEIFSSLSELDSYTSPCLFTPHTRSFHGVPNQQNWNLIRAGVINADFQVWRSSREVIWFLNQWLEELCSPGAAPRCDFEYDQLWLPYALSNCGGELIKHPGYGVSYYNMHERELQGASGNWTIRDHLKDCSEDLRSFHYSGFDMNLPDGKFTKYPCEWNRKPSVTELFWGTRYKNKISALNE